jgi:hypothetical protein
LRRRHGDRGAGRTPSRFAALAFDALTGMRRRHMTPV